MLYRTSYYRKYEMQIEWIVIHLLCIIAGALDSSQEEQLKVFDWQPQQVHIAFGGKTIDKFNHFESIALDQFYEIHLFHSRKCE